MPMSKKDYRAFAEMLHEIYREEHIQLEKSELAYQADIAGSAMGTVVSIASAMCQIFARDNSRFDSARFMTAVKEGVK